jgi:hypothetical protein
MTNFYKQYKSIEPWLKRKDKKTNPNVEHLQTAEERKKLDGMYEVRGRPLPSAVPHRTAAVLLAAPRGTRARVPTRCSALCQVCSVVRVVVAVAAPASCFVGAGIGPLLTSSVRPCAVCVRACVRAVHFVRMLQHLVPQLLVELGQVPRPRW